MTASIAIANSTGGTGKTAVAKTLAEFLSGVLGLQGLGIDFSPQCNFSQRLIRMAHDPSHPDGIIPPPHPDYNADQDPGWNGRSSSAAIFSELLGEIVPYPTRVANFDLLPGDGSALRDLAYRAERRLDNADELLPLHCTIPST